MRNDHVTVHWLAELAPTIEARDAALGLFGDQVSPEKPPMFFSNEALRVWGFIGEEAVLLFKMPASP